MNGLLLPDAVCGFLGMHLALRAEVADLRTHLAVDGDPTVARRRAELLGRVLLAHHTTEDRLLWPALEARQPGFEPTTAVLEDQHVRLDHALDRLRAEPETIEDVQALLEEHLQAEEQHALPVWLASFSAEEHDAFGRRLRQSTPLRQVGLLVPWLLDAAPAETVGLAWSQMPKPMRAAYRLWWKRAYEWRWGRRPSGLHDDRVPGRHTSVLQHPGVHAADAALPVMVHA
jgi:hypothetical protein